MHVHHNAVSTFFQASRPPGLQSPETRHVQVPEVLNQVEDASPSPVSLTDSTR